MMTKRITSLLLVMLMVSIAASAQLLWKVTGNQLQHPSYLFGTMHQIDGSFIDSIDGLGDVIKSVDGVWIEIEKDKLLNPEALSTINGMMMAPADSTLSQLLSPEGMRIVAGVVDKYFNGMVSMKAIEQLKPAAIITQLEAVQLLQVDKSLKLGNPDNMLDAAVQTRAAAAGKASHSLETVEFQARLLFGYPLNQQAADLLEFCKADDKVVELIGQLVSAYKKQDLDKILRIMEDREVGGSSPQEMERTIYARNRNWVKTLVPVMQQGSVLVAVGAGHLPSSQGLIALLRDAGYTVEAVK